MHSYILCGFICLMLAACTSKRVQVAWPKTSPENPATEIPQPGPYPFDIVASDIHNDTRDCYFPICRGGRPAHFPTLTVTDKAATISIRVDGETVDRIQFSRNGHILKSRDNGSKGQLYKNSVHYIVEIEGWNRLLVFSLRPIPN